jgi:hypothetical protein
MKISTINHFKLLILDETTEGKLESHQSVIYDDNEKLVDHKLISYRNNSKYKYLPCSSWYKKKIQFLITNMSRPDEAHLASQRGSFIKSKTARVF